MNIKITAEGRSELDKLGFDISSSIQGILECVSKLHYKGISYVLVTTNSVKRKGKRKTIQASYIKKHGKNPAYIELYLKNIFAHIHSFESFKLMIPIQEFGLARALLHEIGHHVRVTQSHGVKNINSEIYADKYIEKRMKIFILKTSKKVENCFKQLEQMANEKKMSPDIIKKMKDGWRDNLEKAKELTSKRKEGLRTIPVNESYSDNASIF